MHLPGYYEFFCRTKIVAGHHALEKIPELLTGLHAHKPLIITDKGVAGAGLIDIVTDAIKDRVSIGSIESDVPPDSDVNVVNRLANVYRKNGCDSIIAVGGGSVIDTAKGVNIVVSEGAEDLMKLVGSIFLAILTFQVIISFFFALDDYEKGKFLMGWIFLFGMSFLYAAIPYAIGIVFLIILFVKGWILS